MDLNNLKPVLADDGAVLEIKHPVTEEVIDGMTIRLRGQDSNAYRKIKHKKQNAILARVSKGKKAAELEAEKLEADTIDELVALTINWSGFKLDGETLEATPENYRKVYTEWEWLRDQAAEFVANRANFFR